MSRRRSRLGALVVSTLLALATTAGAAPADVAPWEEGQPQSAFLLRRLSFVLEGLRSTAAADPALKSVLDRIRLRAPEASLFEAMPNAYALTDAGQRFILIESRFVNQIAALSAAGAYITIAEYSAGRAEICRQLAATDREAKQKGVTPVFKVRLETVPEFAHPPTRRALEKLQGLLADESMVWFLLHEAGHHVRGHAPNPSETEADSRARESDADRWASQTMSKLGFGLFGPYRYLAGFAVVEGCLRQLGYLHDESESTHPSWLRRAVTMSKEFNVRNTGWGYPRVIYVPAEPTDLWLHIARRGDDASTYVTEGGYRPLRAASHWEGAAVTVYTREQTGGRIEIRVPDANLALVDLVYTQFDAANRRVRTQTLFAIQLNPTLMDWMEVAPGLRMGDLLRQGRHGRFREHLRAAGVAEGVIEAAVAAQKRYEADEAAIVVAYMKGQLRFAELEQRYAPVHAAYEKKLVDLLGADGLARLRQVVQSDPLSKWAPGRDAAYYRKLEDELLNYNFDRGK